MNRGPRGPICHYLVGGDVFVTVRYHSLMFAARRETGGAAGPSGRGAKTAPAKGRRCARTVISALPCCFQPPHLIRDRGTDPLRPVTTTLSPTCYIPAQICL